MNNYQGALLDTRPEEEKAKDFILADTELAGASFANWQEKPMSEWKNYPARNQTSSSSCVAQAFSKALFTLGYDVVSAHPIYRSRKNFDEKGMWLYNGAEILKSLGTVSESMSRSQNLGEYEMNRAIEPGVKKVLDTTPIKIGAYAYVNGKSIEDIAEAIEENKHCVLTFGASNQEWTDIPEIKGAVDWYHAVCAVDYVLYNGKKYIVIEDSWGENVGRFGDRRLISEEFIKERCTGAMVVLPYVEEKKKAYKFTQVLRLGSQGKEVEELQKALKQLGFFPQTKTTEYFGKVTELAVKKFQEAYKSEILTPSGLKQPTGIFGIATMKKLNELNNKWYQSSAGSGSISLTVKGVGVAVIPVVVYLASQYGVALTENEITEIINAGLTVLSTTMIFVGLVRKLLIKFQ